MSEKTDEDKLMNKSEGVRAENFPLRVVNLKVLK